MIVLVNFDIYLHFFQRRVVVRPRPVVVAPRRPFVPVVPMAATAAVVGMAAGAAASSNRNSQPQIVIIKVTYSRLFLSLLIENMEYSICNLDTLTRQ